MSDKDQLAPSAGSTPHPSLKVGSLSGPRHKVPAQDLPSLWEGDGMWHKMKADKNSRHATEIFAYYCKAKGLEVYTLEEPTNASGRGMQYLAAMKQGEQPPDVARLSDADFIRPRDGSKLIMREDVYTLAVEKLGWIKNKSSPERVFGFDCELTEDLDVGDAAQSIKSADRA